MLSVAAADNIPTRGKKVDSNAALRETGYVAPGQPGSWWHLNLDSEDTPELRWPWSVKVYDRMRRQDAKVRSVLRAAKSPLLATTWRLEQGQASDEVTQHVSRDLGLPIKGVPDSQQVHNIGRRRGRFSWAEHLRLALLMLDFGHSAFEQVYHLDEAANRLHLRKLGPRFPASIAKWDVASDGGLVAIEQHPRLNSSGASTSPRIPVNRLVVYSHEREGAEWWGQSLLRPAYKHWLIKDRMLRVDAQSIERNGMGIPVHELDVRLATGETGSGVGAQPTGALQAHIDAGQDIATAVRAGDNSGASLTPGGKLRLVGVEGQLPDALKSVLYHDDQIGTAVLAHFLNLGRQTGSWALGTTFQDFFVSSLTGTGNYVADIATQHIVEDLVDVNYGEAEPAPRIVFDDLSGQDQALAYAIKALVDSGVITPDDALQTYLRAAYKLPEASGTPADTSDRPHEEGESSKSSSTAVSTGKRSASKSSDLDVAAIRQRADAVGVLARSGFDPVSAAAALGLPDIEHTGMLTVSIKDHHGLEEDPNPAPDPDSTGDDQ